MIGGLDSCARCSGCGSVAFAHEGSGIVCLRCELPVPGPGKKRNMKKSTKKARVATNDSYKQALKSPEWADVMDRAHNEPHCSEIEMTPSTAIKLTFVVPYKGAVALFDALIAARKK